MSSGGILEGMNGTSGESTFRSFLSGLQATPLRDKPNGCDGCFWLCGAQPVGGEGFSVARTPDGDFAAEFFSIAPEAERNTLFADSSLAMGT